MVVTKTAEDKITIEMTNSELANIVDLLSIGRSEYNFSKKDEITFDEIISTLRDFSA